MAVLHFFDHVSVGSGRHQSRLKSGLLGLVQLWWELRSCLLMLYVFHPGEKLCVVSAVLQPGIEACWAAPKTWWLPELCLALVVLLASSSNTTWVFPIHCLTLPKPELRTMLCSCWGLAVPRARWAPAVFAGWPARWKYCCYVSIEVCWGASSETVSALCLKMQLWSQVL